MRAPGVQLTVSSNTADAARLIDGNLSGGWKADRPLDAGQTLDIGVDLGAPRDIDALLIQPRNWQPGSRAPSLVELAASSDPAPGSFTVLGQYELLDVKALQALRFPTVAARYLRIRILALQAPGRPGLGEVAVVAAGTPLASSSPQDTAADGGDVISALADLTRAAAPAAPSTASPVAEPAAATAVPPTSGAAILAPSSVAPFEPVDVRFQGFPGSQQDWVTLVPADLPDDQYRDYVNLDRRTEGSLQFKGVPPGAYELRGYFDWPAGGYKVQVRQPLTVAGAAIPSPPAGSVNIASLLFPVTVEGTDNPNALFDGVTTRYAPASTYAAVAIGSPLIVKLDRAYALDEVRIELWQGDPRTTQYRLEGSRDGSAWDLIADRATGENRGWQVLPADGHVFQFLRFIPSAVGNAGDPAAAALSEIEVYSSDPAARHEDLPAVEIPPVAAQAEPPWTEAASVRSANIAAHPYGSSADGTYGYLLLDGHAGPEASSDDIAPGDSRTIRLDRSYRIDAIRLMVSRAGDRPYSLTVEVSKDSQSWKTLLTQTQPLSDGWLEIDSGQTSGQFVRIVNVGDAAADDPTLHLLEVEVHSRDAAPLTAVASFDPGRQVAYGNPALALWGGRVEQVSSALGPDARPGLAIDGVTDQPGWSAADASLPQEIVLSFAGRRRSWIDGLLLYRSAAAAAHIIELDVSDGMPGEPWRRIGRFGLYDESAPQRLQFAPVEARLVRLSVIAVYRPDSPIGFDEIVLHEAVVAGRPSMLPYVFPGFAGGANLADPALGARLVRMPSIPDLDADSAPTNLFDGLIQQWGWFTPFDGHPLELVVALPGSRAATIGAVALRGNGAERGYKGRGDHLRTFEIAVSTESPDRNFTPVGTYQVDPSADYWQLFSFAPVSARYVRLKALSSYGDTGALTLGEWKILEATGPARESVLSGNTVDILDYRLGGFMAVPTGTGRLDAIDGDIASQGWSSHDGTEPPVSLTFGFRDAMPARFDRVLINPRTGYDPASWVRRVKLLASDNPVSGFTAIGEYEISGAPQDQVLSFPPVTARFLQLRLLENGGASFFSLGEIKVIEAPSEDHPSVLVEFGETGPTEPGAVSAPMAMPAAAMHETEPNDSPATATPLAFGATLAGSIEPFGDVDHFRLDNSGDSSNTINMAVMERPSFHIGLAVSDQAGRLLDAQPLYDRGTAEAHLTWHAPPGIYDLAVSRPANSIVILGDQSGSTGPVRRDIAAAVASFVRELQPTDEVSIAGFCSSYNEFTGFTRDRAVLAAAAAKLEGGCDGTALYQAVGTALDKLGARPGAKAILLVTDGEDSGEHRAELYALWSRLANTRVKIYSLGYGAAAEAELENLGARGHELMRAWCLATGGTYFDAPSGAAVRDVYRRIAEDFSGTSRYLLTPSMPAGTGTLSLIQTGETIAGINAPRQIELILDASGSMMAKLRGGSTRIQAAKQVMQALVKALPDGLQVGLRVYGHRYPKDPKDRSCKDSELLTPFAPLDRRALAKAIDAIKPRGQTPIGFSLAQLPQDFKDAPGQKMVVIVTDGIESCDPKPGDAHYPPDVVAALKAEGIELKVNIIGLDIGESETRKFLTDLATAGGGRYFDAASAAELSAALQEAMRAAFEVSDSGGSILATGRVGETVTLPAGTYQVDIETDPPRRIADVEVVAGRETQLRIEKEGARFDVARSLAAAP